MTTGAGIDVRDAVRTGGGSARAALSRSA
jgi:hypothetical protein